ncbi:hypothetical protein BCR39DRAFT_358677 [Naematelia encephala]|uniref:Uncharacterized protein n=1 Tax=Naematelia encephala TaxID=71784 RepID=A0A1Y2BDM1_9TREE|nr:hypothetical protein BCR39DRAFT_358677 [Naematelia encephala]
MTNEHVSPSSLTPKIRAKPSLLPSAHRQSLQEDGLTKSEPITYTQVTASGLTTWRRQPKVSSVSGETGSRKRLGMGMQGTPARKKVVRPGSKSIGIRSTPRKSLRPVEDHSSSSIPISDLPDPDDIQSSSSIDSAVTPSTSIPEGDSIVPTFEDVFGITETYPTATEIRQAGSRRRSHAGSLEDTYEESISVIRADFQEMLVPLNDLSSAHSSSHSPSLPTVRHVISRPEESIVPALSPSPFATKASSPAVSFGLEHVGLATNSNEPTTFLWSLEEPLNDRTGHRDSPMTSSTARRSRNIQARVPTPFKLPPRPNSLRYGRPSTENVTHKDFTGEDMYDPAGQDSINMSTPRPLKRVSPVTAIRLKRDDVSPPSAKAYHFKKDVFLVDKDVSSPDWDALEQEALASPNKYRPIGTGDNSDSESDNVEQQRGGTPDDLTDFRAAIDWDVTDVGFRSARLEAPLQRDSPRAQATLGPISDMPSSKTSRTQESCYGFRWVNENLTRREKELEPLSSPASSLHPARSPSPIFFSSPPPPPILGIGEGGLLEMPHLYADFRVNRKLCKGAWRGADMLKRMQAGNAILSGEERKSDDHDRKLSGRRWTERRQRWYETEMSSDAKEARKRRVAHYRDLEKNYQLHVEYVLS